ncbi:MAG TPA: MoxR family ATPase [Candidatus Methylacidiphilales bacterium]|nr:MoxR family ATPase [Candidatus Methylacidiphilales bacterium]
MSIAIDDVLAQLDEILLGKDKVVRLAFCCLLARGHLLIEDIPGVGKTTLAHALAKILGLEFRRVQFTSDLLPADVLGNAIFDPASRQFVFHPGPIFTQMLLADEVNRATPKAQSALLEAMEEGQVTIDGETHALPLPFFVIATQNPQHQIGTYPLPESQLDRFLMRLELGFPGRLAEREMLAGQDRRDLIRRLQPLVPATQLFTWQDQVKALHVSDAVRDYVLDLLERSRQFDGAAGLSPRAGLALQRCAQAWAFASGRNMVMPEDVQAVAPSVMAHRLSSGSGVLEDSGLALTEKIIRSVPVR